MPIVQIDFLCSDRGLADLVNLLQISRGVRKDADVLGLYHQYYYAK